MNDPMAQRRIRIGIDTGGTFTDVVALDEDSGELVTTKTPSTPANPADGFLAGIEKVLALLDEIHEKYGFEGRAIVTMEEVTEYLYNREHDGRVVIDDTIKAAIDEYYKQYGCK